MKKIVSLLLFVGLFFIFTVNVSAEPLIDDTFVFVKYEIAWHDYDDKLGYRPDEITLQFSDDININRTYQYTFKKDEVDIRRVDDETTIWSIERIVYMDHIDGAKIYYTENATIPHYSTPLGDKDYITRDNKTLTVDFYILPFRTITYTEHWDDDNARDSDRYAALFMQGEMNRHYTLSCANRPSAFIDENTCQRQIHIEDAYHVDESGNPLLDKPLQFTYKMIDYFIDYDYDIQVDEAGNIDVYIKHEPYRINDSKVTINWDDINNKNNKRPSKLVLDLYNVDKKEQTIVVTEDNEWSTILTSLYKNYKFGKTSEYTLKIENSNDYEFTVIGNTSDGFIVNAKYIGEQQEEVDTNAMVSNPDTSDSIIIITSLLVVSLIGILVTVYKIKKQ